MESETHDVLDRVYRQALQAAEGMTQPGESLKPFAITETSVDSGGLLASDPGLEAEEAVDLLWKALRQQQGEGTLVAFGLVNEVVITDNTGNQFDALRILLEHKEPACLGFVIPYKESEEGRLYSEVQRIPADAQVFV